MTPISSHGKYSNCHHCFVQECKNSTIKTPGKLWIRVPSDVNIRNAWLKLAKRDPATLTTETNIYFCEDHFDFMNGKKNCMQCKMIKKIPMMPNCILSRCDYQKRNYSMEILKSSYHKEIGNRQSKINEHGDQTNVLCEESELLACRACLATGVELHGLRDKGVGEVLAEISGCPVQQTDRYPQFVCRTCVCLLRKLVAFRRRCQAAVRALRDLEAGGGQITTESLATLKLQHPFHLAKSKIEISSIGSHSASTKIAECKMETTDDDNQIDKLTDDCGELYGDSDVDTNVEFVQTQFTVDKTTDNPNYNEEASSFDMCSSGLLQSTKVKIEETTKFEKKDVSTGEDFDTTPANINNNNAHRKNSHHTPIPTEPVDSDISNTTELITKDGEGVLVLNEGNNKKKCNQTDVTSDVNHKMLDRHSRVCAPSIWFPRDICSYTTGGKTKLIQHKQAHSKESAASDAATSLNNRKKILHTNSQTKGTIDKPYSCNLCHKFFSQKSKLVRHKKKHTDEKLYICDLCGKKCSYRSNFIKHLIVHSDVKSYSCNICHMKFKYSETLKLHQTKHTDEKSCSCNMCDKTFKHISFLKRHRRVHTDVKPYSCNMCHKNFKDNGALAKHKIIHTGEKKHSCNVCQTTFSLKEGLERHKKIHTDKKPHCCNVCQKTFYEKYTLTVHMRKHTGEKPHSCKVCHKKFAYRSDCSRHEKRHTDERPYSCNVCHKNFKLIGGLFEHQKIHTIEKPHTCDVCKNSFRSRYALEIHKRSHSDEKPYSCDICHKTFKHKYYSTLHYRVHTGEKPYSCKVCHKKFGIRSGLNRHLVVHTGEKPYSCNACQRQFNLKSNLTRHLRRHTSEKKYSCDICHKKFKIEADCATHKKIHREKRFSCEVCDMKFKESNSLLQHQQVHTGEKPYSCNVCKKEFYWKNSVVSHIRKHTERARSEFRLSIDTKAT